MNLFLGDSLTNLVSGMGTGKDKLSHAHFRHHWLGRGELDAMYQTDWLSGTIVDAPVDDMTREWRSWKAGPKQAKAIEAAERQFQVRQKVNKALKMARLYGGAAIIIGDGAPNPMSPLDAQRFPKGGLKYLHTLSRYEISAGPIDRDPLSPFFGEPEYYTLGGTSGGATIHPSRVIRFLGQARLETTWAIDGWGLSTLQRVYDAVRQAIGASANAAALLNEAKLDVISIEGLTQNVRNPEYRAQILTRFALANESKSNTNALLLDAAEKWDRKELSLGGVPNVIKLYLEIAAGAANIPATRLLGTSAKGLNATGAGDLRHYYDTLSSSQENDLSPALERLDEVLLRHALGAHPASVRPEWKPLWQLTDAELAAVALQKAQTTQIYAILGVMDPEALRVAARAQLVADNVYPGLEQTLELHTGEAKPLIIAAKGGVNPGKVSEGIASNSNGLKE